MCIHIYIYIYIHHVFICTLEKNNVVNTSSGDIKNHGTETRRCLLKKTRSRVKIWASSLAKALRSQLCSLIHVHTSTNKIESALQNQPNYIQFYFYTWSGKLFGQRNQCRLGMSDKWTIWRYVPGTWNLQEMDHLSKHDLPQPRNWSSVISMEFALTDGINIASTQLVIACHYCGAPSCKWVINHMINYRHYRYITKKTIVKLELLEL